MGELKDCPGKSNFKFLNQLYFNNELINQPNLMEPLNKQQELSFTVVSPHVLAEFVGVNFVFTVSKKLNFLS